MNRPDPKDYQSRQLGLPDYERLSEYGQAMELYCDYLERLVWLKITESNPWVFIRPT